MVNWLPGITDFKNTYTALGKGGVKVNWGRQAGI